MSEPHDHEGRPTSESHEHDDEHTVERHADVAVVGGSAAGLAAALQLGRERRRVIVLEGGEPRDGTAGDTRSDAGGEGSSPAQSPAAAREEVRSHGVEVLTRRAGSAAHGPDGRFRVEMAGGGVVLARQVLVATGLADDLPAIAGLAERGDRDLRPADATGATGVPGVYVADPLLPTAAHGSAIGTQMCVDLADEDLTTGRRRRASEDEWDGRFAGEPVFSGNPNGTLVAEVAGLTPGRALDVGAGEGADAVWLAEQGWQVTATDLSSRALDRVAAAAAGRGVAVRCLHADVDAADPFGSTTYDLVSAQYPAVPRSPEGRAVANLLAAVAPGGTLLVVHHDMTQMRALAGDDGPAFDGDAYVQPSEVAAAVRESRDLELEVDERRPRPGGHATVDVPDVVVRARRRA